ncbi:MAG TPA: helix-turn-helix domain-containing protein [Terriglobales bacterium]|nr:helix-turn-helix domain-containing protein [Terriglobales bacterium]
MTMRRVGMIGFEGLTALDLVGPSEAFANAYVEDAGGKPQRAYEIVVLGLTRQCFTAADSGLVFRPHTTLERAPELDTLVVPGGPGLREPATQAQVAGWLKQRAGRIRRVASVCTGLYGVAAAGLLDGRRATTHWAHAADAQRRFPRVRLEPDALYIKDGKFYSSAGITAGIDLALTLIEEDLGPRAALAVARELVVYLKRPGGQEQFSEPLRFQTQSADRFADLAAWVAGHLRQDLSVEALAARACLCPRHFTRRFKKALGTTPADFVERLRLDEARRRLSAHGETIEEVADSVGFHSGDAFRRAFERRFGVTPSGYRERFVLGRAAAG